MNYDDYDFAELFKRDDYLSPEEVDVRRRVELAKLAQRWLGGTSVWTILHDFAYIMDVWAFSSFCEAAEKIQPLEDYKKGYPFIRANGENTQEEIEAWAVREREGAIQKRDKARADLTQHIKPCFLDGAQGVEGRHLLEKFLAGIEKDEQASAYAVARSFMSHVFGVSVEPEPEYEGDDLDEYLAHSARKRNKENSSAPERVLKRLNDQEESEQARCAANFLTGTLEAEPEENVLERLSPYLTQMKERAAKRNLSAGLIKTMHVAPNGSGMIKIYNFNPTYLPPEMQELAKKVLDDGDGYGGAFWEYGEWSFDPYQAGSKECIYGTTVAQITTYDVMFDAASEKEARILQDEVQKALECVGRVLPAFGLPTDHDSQAYERPYVSERRKEKKFTHVFCEGNRVSVYAKLDLDDLLNLYYLLEHLMVPSESLAQSLYRAISEEARSAPQSKEDMGGSYDAGNEEPDTRQGHLAETMPEHILQETIKANLSLYASNTVSPDVTLKQMILLAGQTLSGTMADPNGFFPPFQALLEQPETQALTIDQAFMDRTVELFHYATGTDPSETNAPVGAFLALATQLSKPLRDSWRAENAQSYRDMRDRLGSGYHQPFSLDDIWKSIAGEDDYKAWAKKRDEEEEAADEKGDATHKEVACRTNIALLRNPVPLCLDRTYPQTPYTSRMPHSPWPRKTLPSALMPFIRQHARPTEAAHKLLGVFQQNLLGS